ncbi:uncharacterized protein LOC115376709 [Myripristis murdjan]|uniref:uncharacterized protein LOC115376709 n=1 Tax=Myripristis murdjan TaxID=586833 RepID=UPI001175CE1F|nr:uncharacterized protein LOC115376709 [Myripristis murdjan]
MEEREEREEREEGLPGPEPEPEPGPDPRVSVASGGGEAAAAAAAADEAQRLEELRHARREETERLLQDLTLEEWRELGSRLLEREPGLVFDALAMHRRRRGAPAAAAGVPGAPWCVCGNCREMPTELERKCCGQEAALCLSTLPSFSLYCLDAGFLRIHRNYREGVARAGGAEGGGAHEPGEDNRAFRYMAYRTFSLWQHGAAGRRKRLLPSCCLWRIRDQWPDADDQYSAA